LQIGFNFEFKGVETIIIDTIIDGFFGLDIYFNFKTTFYSSITGDEIFNKKLIFRNYLMGKF
jgi:hypothetical protein